jgi:hypothetical protein
MGVHRGGRIAWRVGVLPAATAPDIKVRNGCPRELEVVKGGHRATW